jgi:hypothetical protein
MKRERFDDYIARFNARDTAAFDEYLAPDMHMQNGTLEFDGVQGMKDHYARIWPTFTEWLRVDQFVSDENSVAIKMYTLFTADRDDPASLFGPVTKGETFEFNGVIMYALRDDRFARILVAYNSFVFTDRNGTATDLGIPH